MPDSQDFLPVLTRIADALEVLAGTNAPQMPNWGTTPAFLWDGTRRACRPAARFTPMPLDLLQGISHQKETLIENTKAFASGRPANNALLWGARGMGKSTLVKSVFATLKTAHTNLTLIEIERDDLPTLKILLDVLRAAPTQRFILLLDDLSFEAGETHWKHLKSLLEGSVEGRPDNVILYATSNRRHLLPREMLENEQRTGIHPHEATEEKVSLSDRFGLWLGFHPCGQEDYLAIIRAYAVHYGLNDPALEKEALAWAITRGNRSGRVAAQFIDTRRN